MKTAPKERPVVIVEGMDAAIAAIEPYLPKPIPYVEDEANAMMWRKKKLIRYDAASFTAASTAFLIQSFGTDDVPWGTENQGGYHIRIDDGPRLNEMEKGMAVLRLKFHAWTSHSVEGLFSQVNPGVMPMLGRSRPYGAVGFSGDVMIPALVETGRNAKVWMSYTPSEVVSQMPAVRMARGHVMIGGLGMGWFARKVLAKKEVTKVTVVDCSEPVIKLFGRKLLADFGDRVAIVNGNAYQWARARMFDCVLMDIWPKAGDCRMDDRWKQLSAKIRREGRIAWSW